MKKKTTWAASVVKKQLQTCCKHQTFSLETTERDDTSQGFGSPSRVIHISSPIKEASNPVLLRRKSFNVSHARSLLTTPEPLTPFRKSVESAIPLCRSSTFKSARLQNVKSSPDLAEATPGEATMEAPSKGKVLHKSGPLPVLQQLFRGGLQGGITSSPLNVKKQLSGPLMSVPRKSLSGAPSPKQSAGGPSPQRISKVKFSPTPHEIAANGKLSDMIAEEEAPKVTQIVLVKVKKQLTPVLDKKGSRESRTSKSECYPLASSPEVKSATEFAMKTSTEAVVSELECPGKDEVHVAQCENSNVREENTEKSDAADCLRKDYISAAVKIQAAYRGHQTRNKLAGELRESSNPSEDPTEEEVEEAPSISTQMSRTDPQRQRRNPPPRVNKGWNGSMRSAQDHQALLRSRQEAALKRERAMEYALSRQRWRTGSRSSKGPIWCTDNRLPDKPGWVWNWLERATRMSTQNSQNRVFDNDFEQNDPQSESLSMKSTVGMCTTDIGSVEVNLGWPLSLRQQHAAGLLQPKTPIPEPPALQIETPTPLVPQQRKRSKYTNGGVEHPVLGKIKRHQDDEPHEQFKREDLSTCTAGSGVLSATSDESSPELVNPRNEAHEIESLGRHHDHDTDLESVGSCEGPVPALNKLPSPVVATKPRLQQAEQHKLSNSNSLKEAAKRDRLLALRPQSQVSVALSDGNSADTTAASVQRPLWR